MNTIQLLPENIINQIKAGEIAESPANILKELIENSVDAGADEIKISIQEFGLDSISIEDNGHGLNRDNLLLAFTRHATSKISKFEDLYQLSSFGFRGEALASISSVCDLECRSQSKDYSPTVLKLNQGKVVQHENLSANPLSTFEHGTLIILKNLFGSTPVRLKFLRSQKQEKRHLERIILAFALSNPRIKFQYQFDEDQKVILEKTESKKSRILQAINTKKQILHFEEEFERMKVEIYFGPDIIKSNTSRKQFIFIQNRLVQFPKIHHTLINSLSYFWTRPFSGHYFIFITIPREYVDVNVHPNKTTIKLYQEEKLLAFISHIVKKSLKKLDHLKKDSINKIPLKQDMNNQLHIDQSGHLNQSVVSPQHQLTSSHHNIPIAINTNYYIIPHDDDYYIFSTKAYYQYCVQFLCHKDCLENDLMPILIPKPIEFNPKHMYIIEYLTQKNWSFSEIKNTLLVQSIPKIFQFFQLEKLLHFWFEQGKHLHDQADLPKELIISEGFINKTQLNLVFKQIPQDVLIKNKIVTKLNSKKLDQLFNNE